MGKGILFLKIFFQYFTGIDLTFANDLLILLKTSAMHPTRYLFLFILFTPAMNLSSQQPASPLEASYEKYKKMKEESRDRKSVV